MPHHIYQMVAIGQIALLSLALATPGWSQDPAPFRGEDEIEGRDTVYRKNVFMHWFTYRLRLEQRREWNRTREGFFGTGGSVNANRLYFHEEFQKRFYLNSSLFAALRHQANEDFDGEYTRTLTGIGTSLGDQWTVSLFGDIVPQKEDIDASVELEWRNRHQSRFRIALVAVDALLNQKTEVEEYAQYPFTLFTEYWVYTDGGVECGAWVNWNTPLELHEGGDDLQFQYEQLTFGASGLCPVGDTAHVLAEMGTEDGTRAWREMTAFGLGTRGLDRTHLHLNLETEWGIARTARMWVGYRLFTLKEIYSDDRNVADVGEIDRNENMLHAGLKWRFRERFFFWPGVYLNQIDLADDFPGDPGRSWAADGLVGKVALPLEIGFDNGASLTFNVSFRTDILRSGGYNVQFFVPL